MREDDKQRLEIHLAGGDNSSREQVSRLIDIIEQTPNAKIKTADLLYTGNSKKLAIDSRTGEASTSFSYTQLEEGKDFDMKVRMIVLQTQPYPLSKGYNSETERRPFNKTRGDILPTSRPS
jgi:hypothetical protein